MSCLCEKLKPKGSEWSQICIGQLWVFDGLRQAEMEAVVFVCKKSTPLWEWTFNEPMQTDYGGFPCQHG